MSTQDEDLSPTDCETPKTAPPWRQALDEIHLADDAMNRGDLDSAGSHLDEACRHDDRIIPALGEMIQYAEALPPAGRRHPPPGVIPMTVLSYRVASRRMRKEKRAVEEYVTSSEAAQRLRVSEETIRRWCRAGRLPAIKLGHDHRIPLRAVLDLTQGACPIRPAEPTPAAPRAEVSPEHHDDDTEQLPPGWVRANTNPQPPHRRRPTIIGQDW